MRILITGIRGFIGARLARSLANAGHDVMGMDLRGRLEERASVTNVDDCQRFCRDVEIVVHCAAIHQAEKVRQNPDAVAAVNLNGTLNLLNAATAAGTRRLVYLSTAKVYGDPEELPSAEDDKLRPAGPYATSKLSGEQLCLEAHVEHGLELAIIRPFSVYGPEQDLDTGYVGMLMTALRDGTVPILPGKPEFKRDFVHIDDVVKLLMHCIDMPLTRPETLNAGYGQCHRLDALVQTLSQVSQQSIDAQFSPPSPNTLRNACADMARAQELFGYQAQVNLAAGLKETLDWFVEIPDACGRAAS